ncbi:uncharacterized protein LOC122011146 [Zingiber officinale]|uniref:uncharacterized protein LOC122011146 n=1 Tax=Zingiber officinale TaxID=94328 RepID=UPI001C4AC87E|nr:uncharacterized protein LOC122011146 [Zingiber officinale]
MAVHHSKKTLATFLQICISPPPPTPSPPPPPPPSYADSNEYPSDPRLRKNILEYNVNEREIVRRYYLQKDPFQPKKYEFPWRSYPKEKRRFRAIWFSLYPNWLEYNIAKDATFCLYCYLFKVDRGSQTDGDSFVTEKFKNWRKKEKFHKHVGNQSGFHNKYLLNHGNFLELLRFLADHNEDINKVALDNAPSNLKMSSPDIQQDIIRSIAYLTTNSILEDLGDELFTILVDEARDVSVKEQMTVALRFVDERGNIVERFLGIIHVSNTTALSLKTAIDSLLCQYGLSISNLRGQGYNGASNMRGEPNGLKSLIMMENKFAYYVHCFEQYCWSVMQAKRHTS